MVPYVNLVGCTRIESEIRDLQPNIKPTCWLRKLEFYDGGVEPILEIAITTLDRSALEIVNLTSAGENPAHEKSESSPATTAPATDCSISSSAAGAAHQ